ncbi:cation diffusion facilitator family transporter NDAI_0I00940 [Naumovozyma dairenensis CBS 421]|uniref:Cation efflux protein transmembrane domain-containing protein n=1 Tax=Naumovozyma dairenensis (strain ATCC 10597 / BCRC 20456 / CBS 421 / NBRC 0211 / NRRL Y-12639) TaxID=1071378 RepID=G0WFV2_NAUDC|nr:hypothetical protein NDAI_0I00940 [Naumovozyma dairenensis CBS 421]CCD26663.1 hypothetical protein NDAI_0I00940 [Naumovozyma dairenensis CBS 421]
MLKIGFTSSRSSVRVTLIRSNLTLAHKRLNHHLCSTSKSKTYQGIRNFKNSSNLKQPPTQVANIESAELRVPGITLNSTRPGICPIVPLLQKMYIPEHIHTHSHTDTFSNILSHSHSHSHSHGHTHTMNNPLLVASAEQIRKNAGVRVTWIGLAVNVGIAVGKVIGGLVFHSQALFADAIHAVSDIICDLLTLFSVRLAASKPTPDYPYGYGKIETIGSLTVSSILVMAGISIGWTSLCAIVGPIIPHTIIEMLSTVGLGSSHSESVLEEMTDINAAWVAAASIAAKEWVFRATRKVAIETNSNVLMANAWHHRVDSLTSLVALVTITSGYLFSIQSLDTLGGLLVSIFIIKAGAEGMYLSVKELIDQSIEDDDPRHAEIESVINEGLNRLSVQKSKNSSINLSPLKLTELSVLSSGPNLRAHATLQVPLQTPTNVTGIKQLETISNHIRAMLAKNIASVKKIDIDYVSEKDPHNIDANKPITLTEKNLHLHLHSHSRNSASSHSHTHL